MDDQSPARIPFDLARYHRLVREGPCFVCALIAGGSGYEHHIVYRDDATIAFLNLFDGAQDEHVGVGRRRWG